MVPLAPTYPWLGHFKCVLIWVGTEIAHYSLPPFFFLEGEGGETKNV